ncbi:NADH pyrophosphatase I of the Nudix family of hydrolases [Ceraceosorus bombacis]|uniref:NAD(+) diphosphatase n=1 Tax=Ceraceosorus bombacis TaxID=401625 RepID=A0A0P1BPC0_9BASI|nr:NADH pyrophosphatase I of the Nudix family of hydrolases [Ceraceosorus bombacis]
MSTQAPASSQLFPSFETNNFYAGNTLNRASWLRSSSSFLNKALHSSQPSARIVLLQHGNPLVHGSGTSEGHLATLPWSRIASSLGRQALQDVFGAEINGLHRPANIRNKDQEEQEKVSEKDWKRATDSFVPPGLDIVFLGILQDGDSMTQQGQDQTNEIKGVPYFALSLTHRSPRGAQTTEQDTKDARGLERLQEELLKEGYDFVDTRALAQAGSWPAGDAAMIAEARSLVDWNERMNYCPACSRRQYSLWGGWKRCCSSGLLPVLEELSSGASQSNTHLVRSLLGTSNASNNASSDSGEVLLDGKPPCPASGTLSNFSYPRTDPTVIMGIVSPDGNSILLGRQKRWPKGFWSCLAGFLEPGESVEEAVKREVLEESGVEVKSVTYHSSQPWPFPANLMIGCLGVASTTTIRLDLDAELEDARFFSREEVFPALEASAGWTLKRHELAAVDEDAGKKEEQIRKERERLGLKGDANARGRRLSGKEEFDKKDSGSVANVTSRSRSRSAGRVPRAAFKIPGPTAIAHVLIASWARGEAHIAGAPLHDSAQSGVNRGKM